MKAGKRDRRIVIQRATITQDPGSGENVETWAALATVWAEKGYRRANENVQAAEVTAIRVVRFAILWSSTVASVNPKDRIVYDGVNHDIIEVNEIGRREGLEIFAQARADG